MNGGLEPTAGFDQHVEAMILARAQRGDMEAFSTVYRQFGRPCFQLALRILGQRQSAEDLVQEVFLKMMDTIGSYRGDPLYHASLSPREYVSLVNGIGFNVIDHAVNDERVGGRTVWLCRTRTNSQRR